MEIVDSLPDTIPTLAMAEAFTDLYLGHAKSFREKLATIELQALFLLLVDTLEHPDHDYDELELSADETSVNIMLSHRGRSEVLVIGSEDEEIGARAMAFISQLPYLNEKHGFVDYLVGRPLTRANLWEMAEALLGKEAASEMKAARLQQDTPAAPVQGQARPRM